MADLKAITGGQTPALRPTTAPSGAARTAQRAFFEAALSRAGPIAPATSAPEQRFPPSPRAPAPEPPAAGRLLRPGSFLDIKV